MKFLQLIRKDFLLAMPQLNDELNRNKYSKIILYAIEWNYCVSHDRGTKENKNQ